MGCLCGEGIVKPTILAIRPHTTLAKHVVSDILSGGLLIGGCLINHYYGLESFQFPSPKNISWLSDCSLYIARLDCKGVPGRWIYHEIEFSTWDRKGFVTCFIMFSHLLIIVPHVSSFSLHVSSCFHIFSYVYPRTFQGRLGNSQNSPCEVSFDEWPPPESGRWLWIIAAMEPWGRLIPLVI